MKNKIYYLSSCSTCQRIIKELGISEKNFDMQDIKTQKITEAQLTAMHSLSGSYESLFSRIALKFRSLGLNTKVLKENDYRDLILGEYTFLKRPVLLIAKKIFVGNAPKTVQTAKEELNG